MAEAAELVSDQIRKEFFEEFFRAASTRTAAHRRGGPLPDLEALASSAITESLEPRMNIADSASAGRDAAEKWLKEHSPAKALRDSPKITRGKPDTKAVVKPDAKGGKPDVKVEKPSGVKKRVKFGAADDDGAEPDADPAADGKRPRKSASELDLASAEPGSITRSTKSDDGTAMLDYFDAAHLTEFPDRERNQQPCAMMSVFGVCKKKDCQRCKSGTKADAGICSLLRAAASEECLKALGARSPIVKAKLLLTE